MPHRSLFWPLALIAVATVTLAIVLVSLPADPRALAISAAIECSTEIANPTYPNCLKTQTADSRAQTAAAGSPTTDPARIIIGCPTDGPSLPEPYPPYDDCLKTRTALLGQTERAGWTDTPVPPPAQAASTATYTPTATTTPTRTQTVAGETAAATAAQTFTPSATRALPTPTATDLEGDAAAIACIPGDTISIEGSADPGLALIVTFGERPVGGGFSRSDGSYRIRLHIGDERPGLYPVLVEERDTDTVVQELLCRVPALTPTPTPSLFP